MRRTRGGVRRWVSWSTFAILAGITAALLLRTNVALLSTQGSSMAPRFHSGDLAITVATDDYRVGDIAAYKSADGPVILHRIIAENGDRFTFKGDNNSWTDPTEPARTQMVGKLWVHVPQLGALVNIRSNVWRVVVLAIAALLVFSGRKVHRRRRRRREGGNEAESRQKSPTRISELNDAPAALVAPIAVVLLMLLLVGMAFHRPTDRETTSKQKYQQEVRFGYTGTAPTGTTYPDGTVSTGAPIFLKLVSSLRFQIGYELSAKKGNIHNAGGNYSIDAIVSGVGSWTRTLPLQPRTNFEGEAFSTEVTIDIPQIRQIVRSAAVETGVASDEVKVMLRATVSTSGFVDEVPISATFDKPLEMTIGTDTVTLTAKTRASDGTITSSETSPYKTTVSKPNRFELFGRRLDVARARALATTGLVLALMWLATIAVIQDRLRHRPEAIRIVHRYRGSIIEITSQTPSEATVDVANIVALVRIAEQSERFILHHASREQDTFLVEDDGTTYRYAIDRWPANGPDRQVERADLPPPAPPVVAPEPMVAPESATPAPEPPVPVPEPVIAQSLVPEVIVPEVIVPEVTGPEVIVPDTPIPATPSPTHETVALPAPPAPHVEPEPLPAAGLVVASDDALFHALLAGGALSAEPGPTPVMHDAGSPPPFVAPAPAPTPEPAPAPAPAPTALIDVPSPDAGTPPPFFGVAPGGPPLPPTLDHAIRLTPLTAAERAELNGNQQEL